MMQLDLTDPKWALRDRIINQLAGVVSTVEWKQWCGIWNKRNCKKFGSGGWDDAWDEIYILASTKLREVPCSQ